MTGAKLSSSRVNDFRNFSEVVWKMQVDCNRFSELRRALTIMNAEGTERQVQQLAAAILAHGRLVSQFHSHHSVGVEERELAFRFRETTHNIVSALVLLEKDGRASRTQLTGYLVIGRVAPECQPRIATKERLPVMKNSEAAWRKKHYEAPKLTLPKLDRAKAQLVARALAGDRDAEDLPRSLDERPLRFGFLYQGIIDFPRVAMVVSLVWVPTGLEAG
jgi:hypothetical protein